MLGTVLGREDPVEGRRQNFCSLEMYISERKDKHITKQNVLDIDKNSRPNKSLRMCREKC